MGAGRTASATGAPPAPPPARMIRPCTSARAVWTAPSIPGCVGRARAARVSVPPTGRACAGVRAGQRDRSASLGAAVPDWLRSLTTRTPRPAPIRRVRPWSCVRPAATRSVDWARIAATARRTASSANRSTGARVLRLRITVTLLGPLERLSIFEHYPRGETGSREPQNSDSAARARCEKTERVCGDPIPQPRHDACKGRRKEQLHEQRQERVLSLLGRDVWPGLRQRWAQVRAANQSFRSNPRPGWLGR